MLQQTPAQSGLLDATVKLRLVNCAMCGVVFGLPAALHVALAGRRGGKVHCPAGHLNSVRPPERAEDILQQTFSLLEEVATLRGSIAGAERELATLRPLAPPAAPLPPEEMKRRVAVLSARSERIGVAGSMCHFCGKTLRGLERHLMREHAAQVAALSAPNFA